MCFSAEVSFGASAVISTVGIIAIKKSTDKKQLVFAMIPLLFGIQQFFEGCLWFALQNTEYSAVGGLSKYGFLIFAELIWPIWIPVSIWLIEKEKRRKLLIFLSLILGVFVSIFFGYQLIIYNVTAHIDQHHIFYIVGPYSSARWSSGIIYLLPAAFPFILSSNKHINYLGVLMLLFFVVSKIFFIKYMISVWCFFAAVLSIYIFLILKMQDGRPVVEQRITNKE